MIAAIPRFPFRHRDGSTNRLLIGSLGATISALVFTLLALVPMLAHAADSSGGASAADRFTSALEQGPLYAAGAAFIGGFLTSLTPCVYPMIAVTVSVFGARQSKSKGEAMLLSTVFVLGIAAMFTPLGLAAGLTGSLFGSLLSNRWVVIGIALVFLALAGSMFGLFEFVLPSKLTNRLATAGGVGYGGAFVLGLVSGVVAAPCTGPVLTGILLWIGKTQSPVLGAAALFAFSLGLGIPFWLVGTFAVRLPKSGSWMLGIKSFFAIVLTVVALYLVKNAFPEVASLLPTNYYVLGGAVVAIVVGVALGAIHLSFGASTSHTVRKSIGTLLCVVGLIVAITWLELPKNSAGDSQAFATNDPTLNKPIAWLTDTQQASDTAKANKQPLLVDFTAEWCGSCKRIARETFPHPLVRPHLERFVMLKIDATNDDDPRVVETQKKYNVVGLPTVILFDSEQKEVKRFTDFVPPEVFSKAIADLR